MRADVVQPCFPPACLGGTVRDVSLFHRETCSLRVVIAGYSSGYDILGHYSTS